ncbi:MAG: hypothetical protein ACRC7S_09835 [Cetobacterium sp.]
MEKFLLELSEVCKKHKISMIGDDILFDKDGNLIPMNVEIVYVEEK